MSIKKKQNVRYVKSGLGADNRPTRNADGMACSCGGYADLQYDMTKKEIIKVQNDPYGFCGRSWQCCARAFKCRICKTRIIINAHSPGD